jgi:phosphatidylethanolamine/phosphatidyl-N-methylethanolamine N-methyltransferase
MRTFDQPAAAVVAGLPLLVRPRAERLKLVMDCLHHAAPGAPFI